MELTVEFEAVAPESIDYVRGSVHKVLTGYHATQFRQMVWKYGKAEATEKYWWFWHEKKEA